MNCNVITTQITQRCHFHAIRPKLQSLLWKSIYFRKNRLAGCVYAVCRVQTSAIPRLDGMTIHEICNCHAKTWYAKRNKTLTQYYSYELQLNGIPLKNHSQCSSICHSHTMWMKQRNKLQIVHEMNMTKLHVSRARDRWFKYVAWKHANWTKALGWNVSAC